MIRRPPRSTPLYSSAASDVYKRQTEDYVDKINTDSLVGTVIEDIVDELDPHSVYIPAQQQQALSESMQGNFEGIGAVSYTHLRAHETVLDLVCRLLLEKKKKKKKKRKKKKKK